ncbi:MAG TPA: TonB-dependent receptor [Holophagaceae bacterium]|nr:TonB-dependent receptor [Holophagaceae bacterium]
MGLHSLSLILVAGAATLPLAARAETEALDKPKPKAEASATVTITAEATPVERVKTPNPVVVLDSEAIRRSGARTLGELLSNRFPGQVLQNGGVGTTSSLFLGGSRGQDVVVLMDGIRVQDAAGLGGANLSALGLTGIDRIEVQSGPCSTRFGAEAMGGVIALYSAGSAAPGLTGEVRESFGTKGVAQVSQVTAYGWTGGWVRAAAGAAQENQATETPNPYREAGGSLGFGQQLGESTLLTLSYRNAYFGVPIPWASVSFGTGPRPASAYQEDRETTSRSQVLAATLRTEFTPTLEGELTLGQALQARMEPDYFTGQAVHPFDSRRNQLNGNLGWKPSPGASLGVALDAYEEFAATDNYAGGKDRGAGRHLGLSLEGALEPVASLRLTASLRHQKDRQSYTFTTSPAQPELDLSADTWKVGANWILAPGLRAYGALGTGFGVPFLSAVMYNQQNAFPGMEPLQKERSRFQQAGLDWASGPWSIRLQANRTRYDNLVYFDLNDYVYRNGADLRIQGAELTVAYQAATWNLEGTYRNQEARDLNAAPEAQLRSGGVIRRPFQSFGLRGERTFGDFRAGAHWGWFGSRYENFGGFPARLAANKTHFNDLGLGLAWTATPALTLGLRGEHLLQPTTSKADWLARRYDQANDAAMIYGFPAQGPTAILDLRYRF